MQNRGRIFGSIVVAYGLLVLVSSCEFNTGNRWSAPPLETPEPPICKLGEERCTSAVERCVEGADGAEWSVVDDCAAQGLLCAPTLLECKYCLPDGRFCEGLEVMACDSTGDNASYVETCDVGVGEACRDGGCPVLCQLAEEQKSNVGCEYWAVDLDNAMIDVTRNAQAQQYAVVVSNPQPDVPVEVTIYQDDGVPGDEPAPYAVANAIIPPLNLRVFKLGPREVDGSPDGEFNTGDGTAWTRKAYKVTSDFPVVAYQFNPLENVSVFSNDASLLKPREALSFDTSSTTLSYVVAAWPQTIAVTDDPNTNFSSAFPINLRTYVTIVGTDAETKVVVRPTTRIKGGGGLPETFATESLSVTIDAFDVLNLETPDINSFNADFTGTLIEADKPVAVFVGSEASDAPSFPDLTTRRCCADHYEEQLDPIRTAGKLFALAHSPSRTEAVKAAGGALGVAPEPEYFRFVSTTNEAATITTTLPAPDDEFVLYGRGQFYEVTTRRDFLAESDQPIHVVQMLASQDAANVPRGLPGGDPSLIVVPPREQYRNDYVFLTPDKYAFDFITIVAPAEAVVSLDDQVLDTQLCQIRPTDGIEDDARTSEQPIEFLTYSCQLSFATVDPVTGLTQEGLQNDGVHRIVSNLPVGVTVFGFDAYVSYAYAGGTELREIAPPL